MIFVLEPAALLAGSLYAWTVCVFLEHFLNGGNMEILETSTLYTVYLYIHAQGALTNLTFFLHFDSPGPYRASTYIPWQMNKTKTKMYHLGFWE